MATGTVHAGAVDLDVAAPAGPAVPAATGRGTPLVLVSIVSVQLGAGFARRLFGDVGPSGVVMLRQGGAALVLLLVARRRLGGRSPRAWHRRPQ